MRKSIRTFFAVVLTVIGMNVRADSAIVARIGETGYATLAAALVAAQNGDVIEILDGTWGGEAIGALDEPGKYVNANVVRYKSLTIQAAAGAAPKFTSTLSLGYDDSSTANATMTVRGLSFENAQLALGNYVQATVENCSFAGSGSSAALSVIESCSRNHKTAEAYPADLVTVRNCTFDGTAANVPAIRLRNSGNVLITGNVIANARHNGILLESNSNVNNAVVKAVVVENNEIVEWNAANVAEGGRGIRAALGALAAGSTVTLSGNVFRKETTGLDAPDFVKITGAANAVVDLSGNDWNDLPLSEVFGNGAVYTCDGSSTTATVVTTRKAFVAQIGDARYGTLAEAFAAAQAGDTVTLLADVDFGDYGATALAIVSAATVTLDLAGHRITGKTTLTATSQMILNQGTLTITDSVGGGMLASGASPTWTYGDDFVFIGSYASNLIRNEGRLVVEAGSLVNAASGSAAYVVDSYGAGTVAVRGGTLETAFASTIRMFYSTGALTVDGGALVSGQRYAVQAMGGSATVAVLGGTLASNSESDGARYAIATYQGGDCAITVAGGFVDGYVWAENLSIAGGLFADEPDAEYLADGFGVIGNSDVLTRTDYPFAVAPIWGVTFDVGGRGEAVDPIAYAAVQLPLDLPVPAATDATHTFAGWKFADDAVMNAIPVGTTGSLALVATWTEIVTVPVAVEVRAENREQVAETAAIKVTKAWVEDRLDKPVEAATAEEINAKLETVEENGNKAWVNYVLGLESDGRLGAEAPQNAEEDVQTVTTGIRLNTVDTGFTVTYQLEEVAVDEQGAKEEKEVVAESVTDSFDIDLESVESNKLFTVKAVITPSGATSGEKAAEVVSETTIGVMKVKAETAQTIVAVPWKSLEDGADITVANLVRTAGLSVGDKMQVYNKEEERYDVWQLDADKTWQPCAVVKVGADGALTMDAGVKPSSAKVARGAGVWLERQDVSKPIVFCGQHDAAPATTRIEAPEESGKKNWNLVASPALDDFDLNARIAPAGENSTDGAKEGDLVVVPVDGGQKRISFEDGKWGFVSNTVVTVTLGGRTRTVVKPMRVTEGVKIPAGTGFFYASEGGAPEIRW